MSRVGKMPINLPNGVTISLADGLITAVGPKGNLSQPLLTGVKLDIAGSEITVSRLNDEKIARANHGLMRALIHNMVEGVSQGFVKKLELNGVGYRVQAQGTELKFNLGYSHDINYKLPEEIKAEVEQNIISISGASKQKVGQAAAEIRALKKPEPYKGKGIKYVEERIIRKSGKSGKETA